ncbi:MAG: hypothetical protein ACRD0Z_08160 [Acidimicrobiales bacterium]
MTVRLKEAADLVTSCATSGPRPFVALEHLEGGTGRLRADVELLDRAGPETGAAAVEPGDVLFGKLRPYLAKTWLADRQVFASTELLCLHPRAGIDGRWLAYLIASNPVVEWAVATSDGTKMPRTSWDKLAECRIEVPRISDQSAIADYLDCEIASIDGLIEKRRKILELLEQRVLSCLDQLIQPGDLLLPLRRFAVVQGGITVDSGRSVSGGLRRPYLRVANVQDGYLDLTEVTEIEVRLEDAKRSTLRPGDVLMTEANGNPMNLGRGTVWAGQIPECLHQNHIFAIRNDRSRLLPELLALLTQSSRARSYFQIVSSQVGIATISKQKVLDFPVPFIPLGEQRHRVQEATDRLGQIRNVRSAIERQVALLHEHRQALVTAAIAGDLELAGVA